MRKSPGTDVSAWAYVIFSSGELQNGYSGVAVSYGSSSLDMGAGIYARLVGPDGDVDNIYDVSVNHSYGRKKIAGHG